MTTANIGRSAQRVYRHYKKHYDEINTLIAMAGLESPNTAASLAGQLPNDLLALQAKADNSLSQLKRFTVNIDELASIDARELPSQQPDLCAALVRYHQDLERLFQAIQVVRSKAPRPKKRATARTRTHKL